MFSLPQTDNELSIEELFYNYSSHKISSEDDLSFQIRSLNENIADYLSLDRVGVWLFDKTKNHTFCKDLFDKVNSTHTHNISIAVATFPSYFTLLCKNKIISCTQVHNTPEIREFWRKYLKERNIQSMINSTIWIDGSLAGIVTGATVGRSKSFTEKDKFIFNSVADTITNWIYQLRGQQLDQSTTKHGLLNNIVSNFFDICALATYVSLEDAIYNTLSVLKETTRSEKVKAVYIENFEAKTYNTDTSLAVKISHDEIKELDKLFKKDTHFWFPECSQPKYGTPTSILKLIGKHVGPCLLIPFGFNKKATKNLPHGVICYYFDEAKLSFNQDLLEITKYCSQALAVISDYIRTQHLYRESLEISRATFENSSIGMVLLNQEGVSLKLNDAAREIFDLTPNQLRTFSVLDSIQSNDLRLKIRKSLKKFNCAPFKAETRITSESKSKKSIILSFAKIATGDGSRIYNLVQLLDITKRQEAIKELAKEKNFFLSVIDSSPNFVFAKDRHGRFILANEAIAEAYGTTKEDIIGKTDADFNDSADQIKNFLDDDLKVINSGEEIHIIDEEVTDSKGNLRILETIKKPLYCEELDDNISLGISIDVTTRKKAENEYKEWLHKLEQSQRLESLGLLASSIAHDFNNILQGVIGNISLANELLSENPQAKHLVLRAQDSAEKAAEITTQLLSYSGKNSCEKKMIDLTETVREAYKLVERLSAKKADIRFDVSLRPLPIFADIRKLRQVVLNLITNAIDSFKSKRGLIYIRTYSATREELLDLNLEVINEIRLDNYAIFEIEDNGSGIPANILERIFEPFFSTKVSGKGIGLAACQGIIKLHEGFIGVSSTVGSGTSFTIGLPLQSSAEIASNLNSSTQLSDAKKLKLNSNFLIIEDEEISSNVCTSMLDHLEFKSTLAKDGKTGIQKYLEFKSEITCVILDVSLPEIDGIEVYSMIRKLDGNIPILLTSGYSLGQISLDISADTQTTFLQKPYTMKQLQDSLNTIIKTDGANE